MKTLPFVYRFSIISCLITIFFVVSGHAQKNDEFIIGKWRVAGTLPTTGNSRPMTWFQEWTFAEGKFTQVGYPPLEQKGKYRIIKSDGDKLTLELFDQDGTFGTEKSKLEIAIDKLTKTLKIGQNSGFKRI